MPRLLKTTGMFCGDCLPDWIKAVQPAIEASGEKVPSLFSHPTQFCDGCASAGVAANRAATPRHMLMTRLAASPPIAATHCGCDTDHCVPAVATLTMACPGIGMECRARLCRGRAGAARAADAPMV